MEDRWSVDATPHGLLAAVYDGHGGAGAAEHAAAGLPGAVLAALEAGLAPADAFRRAFGELDAAITDEACGTTVAALLAAGPVVTTAHVGDSRILRVARRTAAALTRDHRLDAPEERARVLRMGAELEPPYVMRGDRGLMMTRSLGDRWLRPVGVIAEPEVAVHALGPDDLALVAATDGLWDVLGGDEAARLVRVARTARDAAEALVEAALLAGARDNVTAVVVRLPRGHAGSP